MTGALWILGVTVAVGIILFAIHKATGADSTPDATPAEERPEGCCGQHIVCEKESMLAGVSKEIVYYDDEELDSYKDVIDDSYTDEQIEQFRDVLYTLKPEEIGGWARSVQLRRITLPSSVKDELIMLAAEARETLHNQEIQVNANV